MLKLIKKYFTIQKYEYIILDTTNEIMTFMIDKKEKEGYKICAPIIPYKNENSQGVLIPMRRLI